MVWCGEAVRAVGICLFERKATYLERLPRSRDAHAQFARHRVASTFAEAQVGQEQACRSEG
jgi:hypothetical protein